MLNHGREPPNEPHHATTTHARLRLPTWLDFLQANNAHIMRRAPKTNPNPLPELQMQCFLITQCARLFAPVLLSMSMSMSTSMSMSISHIWPGCLQPHPLPLCSPNHHCMSAFLHILSVHVDTSSSSARCARVQNQGDNQPASVNPRPWHTSPEQTQLTRTAPELRRR
jgi:hypothetical protein